MVAKDWLPASIRAAGQERKVTAGQSLFRAGDRTHGLYEIVSGTVRLVRIDASGRETILYAARAGDPIAEASLFAASYHCDAIASTNAIVRLYPKAAVLTEFRRSPAAAEAFMHMLTRQIMTLRTRLEQRNIHSARDRVRHYLTVNAGPDGRTIALSGTLKDLAGELGLTHEALYRTLADMAKDGDIERRNKGMIRLLDPI